MIKKKTKFIFKGGNKTGLKNIEGGMPLSKGDVVCFHHKKKKQNYLVVGKKINCMIKGKDQIVNITYVLKQK